MPYRRDEPEHFPADHVHTCYDGHDCEEKWKVGHHLAQSLHALNIQKEDLDNKDFVLCEIEKAIHHIRKAWDKCR